MNKEELRKKYRLIRDNLPNKEESNNIIYEKIINDKVIINSNTILLYVSINSEVDTKRIIEYYLGKKKIAIPKINKDKMNFYYINSFADLTMGKYNILEPITKTEVTEFNSVVCLVPGICFSEDGYRIGYGKGYYDKYLDEHDIYTIGLCYKKCLVKKITKDKHDKRVTKIVTD